MGKADVRGVDGESLLDQTIDLSEEIFHEFDGVVFAAERDMVPAGRNPDSLEFLNEPQILVPIPEKGLEGVLVREGDLLGCLVLQGATS